MQHIAPIFEYTLNIVATHRSATKTEKKITKLFPRIGNASIAPITYNNTKDLEMSLSSGAHILR